MPEEPNLSQPSDSPTSGAEPAHETGTDEAERKRKQRVRTGVAFGIGSAALVAALLYTNRPKKKDGQR